MRISVELHALRVMNRHKAITIDTYAISSPDGQLKMFVIKIFDKSPKCVLLIFINFNELFNISELSWRLMCRPKGFGLHLQSILALHRLLKATYF